MFVAEHDNDAFAASAKFGETMADQLASDAAALVLGQHGHRSEGDRGDVSMGRFYCHAAE